MRENAKWFWMVVCVQVGFLLAWAGWHEYLRTNVPSILLKVHPADPRDVIRGDYMFLNYDISRVPRPEGEKDALRDRTLYVILEKRGDYHEVVGSSRTYPSLKEGQVVALSTENYRELDGLHAMYGIETYFVAEGKGTPPSGAKMTVRAALSPAHRLYIKEVMVNGARFP